MGKIRIKTLGLDEIEKKQKQDAKVRREEKKAQKKALEEKEVKKEPVKKEESAKKETIEKKTEEKKDTTAKKQKPEKKVIKKSGIKSKSKKYLKALKEIDPKKNYPVEEAVKLIKKINFVKFDSSFELHLVLKEKDLRGEVVLPHGTGKKIRIAIIDDKLIDEIDSGKINFDILIAHPSFMPKLVKYAKILGPRGLMPNPKAGTVSDKPEEVVKKYQKGSIKYRSEKDNPLMHQVIGKLSFSDDAIKENIIAFVNSVNKSKIQTAYLCSSMSPSLRLDIEKI